MTTNPCVPLPGWGSIAYGAAPWAGTLPINLIPAFPPYEVFCLGPCGSLLSVAIYPEVDLGPGAQWNYDSLEDAVEMVSGYTGPLSDRVYFDVETNIPDSFTVEWTVRFDDLPLDFSSIADAHVHLGVGSHQGGIVGFFFSQTGIAYEVCPDATTASPLPASAGIIAPGETYVIRVICEEDALVPDTGLVYVYITKSTDVLVTGHVLRFVLPFTHAPTACPLFTTDKAWISVKGQVGEESGIAVSQYCVSSSILAVNYPPIADPGPDQAIQLCHILMLDGSGSYDPEGLGLTYKWRLLEAPAGHPALIEGLNGQPYPLPVPTGFTNKWYSPELEGVASSIVAGDVLVVDGSPYDIVTVGTDGLHGWHVEIDGQLLEDDLDNQSFVIVHQNVVSNAATVKATFYPEIAGFYKFDLKVFDGVIWSAPTEVVANALTSSIPRGCVPDMSFIWGYLSSTWRLVDDKERYETLWSGAAQFMAAELLNLWQYEYSKSLRDVQRTFTRRWLRYPLVQSLEGDTTTLRAIYSPADSSQFDTSTGVAGIVGTSLTIQGTLANTYTVTFYGTGNLSGDQVVSQLTEVLPDYFSCSVVTIGTQSFVRIASTYAFSIVINSTPIFSLTSESGTISGTGGSVAWGSTAYLVQESLSGLGIQENDQLEIDGQLYRIIRVQDSGSGTPNDLITLKDELPATASADWSIPSFFRAESTDLYAGMATAGDLARILIREAASGNSVLARRTVLAASEFDVGVVGVDLTGLNAVVQGGSAYSLTLVGVHRKTRLPLDDLVVDIPYLQQVIKDPPEETLLRRNLDFFIEEHRGANSLRFDQDIWVHEAEDGTLQPDEFLPFSLWAEETFLDNRPIIEDNFGKPIGFTIEDLNSAGANVDYLSAVRGLWYLYFSGPTLENLRTGVQILLGLPFAEVAGVIEEIRTDYSPTQGRLLIRDTASTAVVRSYTYPRALGLEQSPDTGQPYAVGDSVAQFAPLVSGVEAEDYKSASWIRDYVNQGGAFEIQKFFRFLVRVNSDGFDTAAMTFARSFTLKIKPTYTYPIFAILFNADDDSIDVSEAVTFYAKFNIFDSMCCQTTTATIFDQPEDGRDGFNSTVWKTAYDTSQGCGFTVDWGYDKNYLCPKEEVEATICTTLGVSTTLAFDTLPYYDVPIYNVLTPGSPFTWTYGMVLAAGTYCVDVPM